MSQTHIKMNDVQLATFKQLKTMLESERELKPSDYDAIALLAVNMQIMDEACKSIDVEGVMIVSHTQYGEVVKANPATALMQQCQQSIRALFGELLMTPKSKMLVTKEISKKVEEEEDPIAALIKKRGK